VQNVSTVDNTLAIDGLLLVHTPPSVVSVSTIVCLSQTTDGPLIGEIGLTIMVINAGQAEPGE
jgi:hypothetical protein